MVKKELIEFETKIGDAFNKGEIAAPIHLYHGNEDIIIEIFLLMIQKLIQKWQGREIFVSSSIIHLQS